MPIAPQIIETIETLEASLPPTTPLTRDTLSDENATPRCVIDTNALLDILFWKDPGVVALEAALRSGTLVALRSQATMVELLDVLVRPQFAGSIEAALPLVHEAYRLTMPVDNALLAPTSATVTGTLAPAVCLDPDDQKFLDLAFVARATFLVSKDKLVLKAAKKLHKFGLLSGTPLDFAEKIRNLEGSHTAK